MLRNSELAPASDELPGAETQRPDSPESTERLTADNFTVASRVSTIQQGPGGVTDARMDNISWFNLWRSPIFMISFLLSGILLSLGHHLYYSSLDGKEVLTTIEQQWALRIGTGFAFLVRAAFAAAIGVAFTQQIWVNLRRAPTTLEGIDSMVSLTTDLTSYLNGEVLRRSNVLLLMATAIWSVLEDPLSPFNADSNTRCMPLMATISPATLSVVTVVQSQTRSTNVPMLDYSNETGWKIEQAGLGYRYNPKPEISRLLGTITSSGRLPSFIAPYQNSTYTLDFFGPSYKCENLTDRYRMAFNTSIGDLKSNSDTIVYRGRTPYNDKLTNLWNTFFVNIGGSTGVNLVCNMWNTSYAIKLGFRGSDQDVQVIQAEPKEQLHLEIPATNVAQLNYSVAQYIVYSKALRKLFNNSIQMDREDVMQGLDTAFGQSEVASCPEIVEHKDMYTMRSSISPGSCRAGSVPKAIEELSRNFTISLLTRSTLTASRPVEVTVTSSLNQYRYNWANLLAAYLTGAVATLISVVIGGLAFHNNGFSASTSFSSILLSTRNQQLDALTEKHSLLPRLPLDTELAKTKLIYDKLPLENQGKGQNVFGQYNESRCALLFRTSEVEETPCGCGRRHFHFVVAEIQCTVQRIAWIAIQMWALGHAGTLAWQEAPNIIFN
ncbi:formylmethionine deformylase-like protein [Paramyrothecium foliicola]|nr:formylmethionine deformylase-like protein [Paramyrothecium foliicola]